MSGIPTHSRSASLHTILLSPSLPPSSPSFLQSIRSFQAGEFTLAKSLSYLLTNESSSSEEFAKEVMFVTKAGEGESSLEFRRRIKGLEKGEYALVRGKTGDNTDETPRKTFDMNWEEVRKLREKARKVKAKLRSSDW